MAEDACDWLQPVWGFSGPPYAVVMLYLAGPTGKLLFPCHTWCPASALQSLRKVLVKDSDPSGLPCSLHSWVPSTAVFTLGLMGGLQQRSSDAEGRGGGCLKDTSPYSDSVLSTFSLLALPPSPPPASWAPEAIQPQKPGIWRLVSEMTPTIYTDSLPSCAIPWRKTGQEQSEFSLACIVTVNDQKLNSFLAVAFMASLIFGSSSLSPV